MRSLIGFAQSREEILAQTGVRDRWTDIAGAGELAGAGVYQCPYCHGWEVRDRELGVYAPCPEAVELALGMKTWSPRVALFTGGAITLEAGDSARLERHGIRLYESALVEVIGQRGRLEGVRLESGDRVPPDALFIHAISKSRWAFVGCFSSSGGMSPASTAAIAFASIFRCLSADFASVTSAKFTPPFCFASPWQREQSAVMTGWTSVL